MIDIPEVCGYLAGIFYASSLIPQIYKSCKTKKLDDLSWGWLFMFAIALLMSMIYSYEKVLLPILISSSIELVLLILLMIMKMCYKEEYDILDDDNP